MVPRSSWASTKSKHNKVFEFLSEVSTLYLCRRTSIQRVQGQHVAEKVEHVIADGGENVL